MNRTLLLHTFYLAAIKTYIDEDKLEIDEDDLSISDAISEDEVSSEEMTEIKEKYGRYLNPLKAACRSGNLRIVQLLCDRLYDYSFMKQKWMGKELFNGGYSPEIMELLNKYFIVRQNNKF